ncbi:hypothetical protein FAZ19_10770 [Sphingobacterium alkalisoli]|uniref:Fibronectin type III domain-containing protein n=1 Tax=Sphingobacterium alkalisoli TaxID=1874115 RepID=A0A4U0H2C0_9SPHI|nr:hypothetical protein [Sphingobacterium alkalisoli]TJY65608.1 hypothetical protein FAZ19_10770 [Sphingobacterium alkalisoli]GGH19430.1 hypothetical protein GCM10011418_23860 [Sphingobacterium alkalisoli]
MVKPIYKSNDATELLRYAESILLKMTTNSDLFPEPVPSLTTLEGHLNAYRDAYAEARFRDKRAVILKGQKGKDLQETIYRLSHYVDAVAKGDEAMIVAAGFSFTRPTTNRIGRTPQAENLRIENVQVGTGILRVRVKPWKHARLYQFEYRKKGTEEPWTSILHSNSMLEVRDLEMMYTYEFRVSYLGTDTITNFSDIANALVV